jgi:hypothetical protein
LREFEAAVCNRGQRQHHLLPLVLSRWHLFAPKRYSAERTFLTAITFHFAEKNVLCRFTRGRTGIGRSRSGDQPITLEGPKA